MILTVISWNADGLKTRRERGELIPILRHNPEIVCFQETRAAPQDITGMGTIHGYEAWFSPLWKNRYHGVGMMTRIHPDAVIFETGDPRTDGRGRLMVVTFRSFTLVNAYFPAHDVKTTSSIERLVFLDGLLEFFARLRRKDRAVILCCSDGDGRSPDLQDSYEGEGMPDKRSWSDKLSALGFFDPLKSSTHATISEPGISPGIFRKQDPGVVPDHIFVSRDLGQRVLSCSFLNGTRGSPHRPVSLDLEIAEPLP